ncbi:Uncharacterised protein [Legionella busanensis]|uniref:Uncharacterized protein n=1 Tax=Legionella busanensis TaxID=190655 RepID=A0A378JMD7_9GAMM|nr:hypothetical protein [Legionella busanensis]STX52395.1 Uncharacterised protein [Legionella busanensis]
MYLNKLVLHIYNFQKEKGEKRPLYDFIREVNPIALSTCMRHIYVFDQSQLEGRQDILNKLLLFLENPREHQAKIKYEYLSGVDAYSFLLLWSIGALNKNKPLDDHRVLASIRQTCFKYETTGSVKKETAYEVNKKFLNHFLLDAKRMHQALLVNLEALKEESRGENTLIIEKFKLACHQCAEIRNNEFLDSLPLFDYSYFLLDKSVLLEKIQQNLREVKDKLSTKLSENRPKKQKNILSFFPNNLEMEKEKQEKIKIKISNLDSLIIKAQSYLVSKAEEVEIDKDNFFLFKSTTDMQKTESELVEYSMVV